VRHSCSREHRRWEEQPISARFPGCSSAHGSVRFRTLFRPSCTSNPHHPSRNSAMVPPRRMAAEGADAGSCCILAGSPLRRVNSVQCREAPNNYASKSKNRWCPSVSRLPVTAMLGSSTEETMFEKAGKFYSDWYDQDGSRKRKSFNSRRAALQFETEQKELAHPKQKARGLRLPHSYSPKSRGKEPGTPSTKPQSSSSLRLVPSPPSKPARPTSRKSITPSKAAATPTQPKQPRRLR
jgi:hypothetical protein